MSKAMILKEKFDVLTFKGVEKDIQRLFSKHASQNEKGQIIFDFFDKQGELIDSEILSLHRSKKASHGISAINLSENVRSVFVSDSYASLICFANQYHARISFEDAGFAVIGADFDHKLLKQAFKNLPKKAKINTVFSTSILGRVMDCKIQDLIQDRDCSYVLSDSLVQMKNKKTDRTSAESIFTFSLRTYCISQGVLQTVRTYKPKQKGVESFYQLNQVFWNKPK
ncbi:hypothetical protein U3A58_10255 [Algoriphagus sp. C2-6-M1]|uniref:hypothetical protein n=1 Tax=Algoriphagus persicinus TaxID=3108754 RepID=UPI002B373ABE|nr:hypothetical protein [Algoriphagus sp. C2-6-M1]MEB2780775.1 hypothetical protein [Algoriphagus sp. C2-6-M1]